MPLNRGNGLRNLAGDGNGFPKVVQLLVNACDGSCSTNGRNLASSQALVRNEEEDKRRLKMMGDVRKPRWKPKNREWCD